MYSYSMTQWVLFFFCYAFIGWIWECFYVSATNVWKKKKLKFINRGFLHGPIIPIYGFAAVSILMATMPFREDTCVVYVVGALTATMFELVTGTAMERLFKVKYWDYSELPLNYNGHICLFVSLFWGFFSVLLVQVIHVPVDALMVRVSQKIWELVAYVSVIVFTCDTVQSFNEAMELRDILESLTENNETIRRLERRIEAIVAFTPIADIDELRDIRLEVREDITYRVERFRWKNEERINKIKEHLLLPDFDEVPERVELIEKLEQYRHRIWEKSNKQFIHAMRQLKRNPMVKSARYQEVIEQLNEWLRE